MQARRTQVRFRDTCMPEEKEHCMTQRRISSMRATCNQPPDQCNDFVPGFADYD